jgi:hypothetical protein
MLVKQPVKAQAKAVAVAAVDAVAAVVVAVAALAPKAVRPSKRCTSTKKAQLTWRSAIVRSRNSISMTTNRSQRPQPAIIGQQ